MCATSSARPQCTTTFPSTGTVSSSGCTLGTTARRTSATSSSPSSCRYVGYIQTPTDQCQVFHFAFEATIFTLGILVSSVFFFFFFRSCSWSMHARHSPKRTKARMASSPPWTSVTLWPPSDTTCSHRLWRRTLSQWVCLCVRGANWQNNLSPQRIFRWWSKNNFHSWKLSRFSSYSAVTSPTFWSSKLLIVHVKLGQKVFHVPQKIINNTYILITCKWQYKSLTGYENIHTQLRQILSRFQSGVISLIGQYWPLSPWAFLIWIIF